MEMIVRIAGVLYRKEQPDGRLSDCVDRFFAECLKKHLPKLAFHVADEYRSHRLYTYDVHLVLESRIKLLQALRGIYHTLAPERAERGGFRASHAHGLIPLHPS
jgi:hypothetical protein